MIRRTMHRRTLTRILLAGILLGGFFGFLLCCPNAKADPTQLDWEAAQVVCTELSADNPFEAMTELAKSLLAEGHSPRSIASVFVYDVQLACPSKMSIFKLWINSLPSGSSSSITNKTGVIA